MGELERGLGWKGVLAYLQIIIVQSQGKTSETTCKTVEISGIPPIFKPATSRIEFKAYVTIYTNESEIISQNI